MHVSRPVILLLLPVAWALVLLSLRGRGYVSGRLILAASIRTLLISALVFAIAGTSLYLPTPQRHVVFLIDESASCGARVETALARAHERIERLSPHDKATIIRFAGRAYRYENSPDEYLRLSTVSTTNIAAALDAAADAIPTGHPGMVIIFTDGIQTSGNADGAAMRLAARNIPVYIPRPSSSVPVDVRVTSLAAPAVIDRGRAFVLNCRIDSTAPMKAKLTVRRGSTIIDARDVSVSPDSPGIIPIVQTLSDEGLHVYTAEVNAVDDTFDINNRLACPIMVRGRPLILYMRNSRGSSLTSRLLGALPDYRFELLADESALTPQKLADTSLIVLDSISASEIRNHQQAIASFVRNQGGGLIMMGGVDSFGAGGYIDTPVESVLPVHCDPRDANKKPIALMVVLDSSGSMGEDGGTKMQTARASAALTLSRLTAADEASVIAFRTTPEVIIPLATVEDPALISRKLAQISPTGGTDIFPALRLAVENVRKSALPLKHILLLSDGKSRPGDIGGIIADCNSLGISISTIATGADADVARLALLSSETGGRSYSVKKMSELTTIFLDDLRRIEGPLVRTGGFVMTVGKTHPIIEGMESDSLPAILSYNRTRKRDNATVLITSSQHYEPLLCIDRAGLGKTVAVMPFGIVDNDLSDTSTNQWGKVILRAVKYATRANTYNDADLVIKRNENEFDISVTLDGESSKSDNHVPPPVEIAPSDSTPETRSSDDTTAGGHPPQLSARLSDLSGNSIDVALRQTGARTYHAEVADASSLEGVISVAISMQYERGSRIVASRYVPKLYPREFSKFTPSIDLLDRIARITDGRIIDSPDEYLEAGGGFAQNLRNISLWLAVFAMVLFVTEMVLKSRGIL